MAATRAEVVQVAVPATTGTVVHPVMAEAPVEVKVTPPPVGVPDPGAVVVTVAVKVTDWPVTDGVVVEATVVVVVAGVTVCVKVAEVEGVKK